jgi:hypothetical protein
MKQQTAVHWLIEKLELDKIEKLDIYAVMAIEKSKQMEMDQIMDAFKASSMTMNTAHEYYLNLYKNESKTNI